MEKEKIQDIAGSLSMGMKCFINSISREIKFIPDYDQYPAYEADSFEADRKEIELNPADYIEIKGFNAREMFEVMANFIETVQDASLKEQLLNALSEKKPFRNFKARIDNSGDYRDEWFAFKDEKLIESVESQLSKNKL